MATMEIKIYGTGTSGHQMVKDKLDEFLTRAGLPYHLENIENISSFISDMVHSIPAIKVNDKDLYEIKMNGRFNSSMRAAIQSILNKSNYGNMLKIIVPTDFSNVSFNAYNYARGLAKLLEGVLYITHVYFPNSSNINELTYLDENAEVKSKKQLDDFVSSINQDWIGEFLKEPFVEPKFITGFPYKELQLLSEEPDTIIAMGSTGSGDEFKKIFGSLSLDVMKSAKCPVFVIPKDAQYQEIKEILFCSENVSSDANAIIEAGKFCEKIGAKLHLAHVVTKVGDDYKVNELESLLANYFKNLSYELHFLEEKTPMQGLKHILELIPIDVLVFNSKHRNFFSNILHTSVTEYAALYTGKPMLVYHT